MIPPDAKPHEVAILEKLLAGMKPFAVQKVLHYEDTTSIYRVKAKYSFLFIQNEQCV